MKLVAKEIEVANQRAKEAVKDINFDVSLNKVRVAAHKKVIKEAKAERKYLRRYEQNRRVEQVASLANQGKSKLQICDVVGIKFNSCRSYVHYARERGLIPKDLIVPTK